MSNYLGRHADLYDIFYADKPYREEAEFTAKRLKTYGAPGKKMLEIACGTGSHAAVFSEMGWEVTAIDYSPDMIRRAREKTPHDAKIRFIEGDMRHIENIPELAEQTFDAAVCLFDSIGYTLTNEGVAATISGIRNILKTGAIFCCEYWHTAAMLRDYSPVRVRRWPIQQGEIIRISETMLDTIAQTAEISYDILELGSEGSFSRLRETQKNRFFSVREMDYFLENGGLKVLSRHDGFSDELQIRDNTWHIVCFSRK